MKFAKELERDAVPEWSVKYLNYKQGKKQIKKVARAISRANNTPRTPLLRGQRTPRTPGQYGTTDPVARTPSNAPSRRSRKNQKDDGEASEAFRDSPAPIDNAHYSTAETGSSTDTDEEAARKHAPVETTPPLHVPKQRDAEANKGALYGSFVPTPPARSAFDAESFYLPDPALIPPLDTSPSAKFARRQEAARHAAGDQSGSHSEPVARHSSAPADFVPESPLLTRGSPMPGARLSRQHSTPPEVDGRPLIRRLFSHKDALNASMNVTGMDQVETAKKEFFSWMDKELEKVESFYKFKEDQAGVRLNALREQLHVMRDQRMEELAEIRRVASENGVHERQAVGKIRKERKQSGKGGPDEFAERPTSWRTPAEKIYEDIKARAVGPRPGSNSKALQKMGSGQDTCGGLFEGERARDYVRRTERTVPYRSAKRKLKLALQEFYRGLELLKSYALLNRTAFRKINKKYDKTVDAHPPLRYMSEKVDKAWFVKSDLLDSHIHAVEDLYARYFERGNHKVAIGKLRSSSGRPADYSFNFFHSGLCLGIGGVFSIQGLIYASGLLNHADPTIQTQTSYLLQIYGGYFLILYLFFLFCFDASIWTRNKINYGFIFEFDPRHNLDWRELAEFPSFLFMVFGLFVWLNFTRYGDPALFIYYPVILIVATLVVIFFPAPILYYRSRRWLIYSHWRLLLAGLYPVEFRDFFLGDMWCSLTYATGNLEMFFCLYRFSWKNPTQCNSTHSRLLGFFTCIPGIWRAFQCLRRYYDTRNVFPHLVNCGKYCMTILYYTTLSIYRIDQTTSNLALFITFAFVNAAYCSVWDILMDWSLGQYSAKKPFLRNVRGYKKTWIYYVAMVLDPILRFNWIFYAIYIADVQHSSICAFLVGFGEVSRRGMWTLFRVENEHCANVQSFKASRDVPLPYELDTGSSDTVAASGESGAESGQTATQAAHEPTRVRTADPDSDAAVGGGGAGATTPGAAGLTAQYSHSPRHGSTGADVDVEAGSLRRRGVVRVGTWKDIMATAHVQDFEKKRKVEGVEGSGGGSGVYDRRGVVNSDDEDEDDSEEERQEAEVMMDVRDLVGRGSQRSSNRG